LEPQFINMGLQNKFPIYRHTVMAKNKIPTPFLAAGLRPPMVDFRSTACGGSALRIMSTFGSLVSPSGFFAAGFGYTLLKNDKGSNLYFAIRLTMLAVMRGGASAAGWPNKLFELAISSKKSTSFSSVAGSSGAESRCTCKITCCSLQFMTRDIKQKLKLCLLVFNSTKVSQQVNCSTLFVAHLILTKIRKFEATRQVES
jgi:hypothetical protein